MFVLNFAVDIQFLSTKSSKNRWEMTKKNTVSNIDNKFHLILL